MASTRSAWVARWFFTVVLGWAAALPGARGATNAWSFASGDSNWTTVANWTLGHVPEAGEVVVIDAQAVSLTNDTADLGGLILTNGGTLSVYASPTNAPPDYGRLVSVSGHVVIAGSSWIYPWSDVTNGGSALFRCQSLTVASGGGINANSRGFRGGNKYVDVNNPKENGYGPGRSLLSNHGSGGAGYGGIGGTTINAGGGTYGDYMAPVHPGSGAGGTQYSSYDGGDGGGLIRIQVSGPVTLDGTLTADGQDRTSYYSGAGSGGGIYVTCDTFSGTGEVRATGGDGRGLNNTTYEERSGGGGGGGRVAIVYDTTAQAALSTQPTVTFDVGGGISTPFNHLYYRLSRGHPGSLYLPDTVFFDLAKVAGGQILVPGFTSFSTSGLSVSQGCLAFPTGFSLNVAQDLTISSRGGIELDNSVCTIGGNFTINSTGPGHAYFYGGPSASLSIGTNLSVTGGWMEFDFADAGSNALVVPGNLAIDNGGFYVSGDPDSATVVSVGGDWTFTNSAPNYNALPIYLWSGRTNGVSPDYGLRVGIGGEFRIQDDCWVYPFSQYTNGGSPFFEVGDLTIADGGGINANAAGFSGGVYALGGYNADGYGPGGTVGSTYGGGGAGYGGEGGNGARAIDSGGPTYGNSNAPVYPGSGGGGGQTGTGGRGGGLVRMAVGNAATVDGTITANGSVGAGSYRAPGSGGGIFIKCKHFVGASTGWLRADGADGRYYQADRGSGGSAGGRIAVEYTRSTNLWEGFAQANGGAGANAGDPDLEDGEPGTIVFVPGPIPPIITNVAPSGVTTTSAGLNGYLMSTGTTHTGVWVLWGESDGGTNLGMWANTNMFAGSRGVGALGTNVDLSADTAYYYRFYATNAGGEVWANPGQYLFTVGTWVDAPDPNADEDGLDPAEFRAHRPDWATNGVTVVSYALSGAASNGLDYALLSGHVDIPAGATDAPVTVTPLADAEDSEGTEDVVLTLVGSSTVISSTNEATVYIADAAVDPTNSCISTGVWSQASIWSSGHKPVDGQVVIVTNDLTLAEQTAVMGTVRVANATITFEEWSTALRATEVVLEAGSVLTLSGAFDDDAGSNRVAIAGSNITIEAGALINVNARGYTAQNGPGAGSYDDNPAGYGGGGAYGGYGGYGSAGQSGGATYGSAAMPLAPGSGGGGYKLDRPDGGQGGGAVCIEATGRVTIDGTVSANGGDGTGGSKGSGGSGGGVYIQCRDFAGTSGVVRANGGLNSTYGSAGGGRIAVQYDVTPQAALNQTARPTVLFMAKRGAGSNRGRPGTLYFTDSSFFPGATIYGGQVVIPGLTELGRDNLASVDGLAVFTGLVLRVTNTLTISGSGGLELSNGVVSAEGSLNASGGETYVYGGLSFGDTDLTVGGLLSLSLTNRAIRVPRTFAINSGGDVRLLKVGDETPLLTVGSNLMVNAGSLRHDGCSTSVAEVVVGGDLVLTNGGDFYAYSGPTNGLPTNYAFLVTVTGDVRIASSSWFYPVSHYLDGGSPLLRAREVFIGAGGGINANGLGFSGGLYALTGYNPDGYGPGGSSGSGYGGGGAGYGGVGGTGPAGPVSTPGGPTYGNSNAPVLPGSGGGGGQTAGGQRGGGVIRLEAADRAIVDGTLMANGVNAWGYTAPGSGGGIYLTCRRFGGAASGLLRANGGNGSSQYYPDRGSGGGGGGRVAVVYARSMDDWYGAGQANGGLKGEDDADTQPGGVGTVVFVYNPPPQGTMVLIR